MYPGGSQDVCAFALDLHQNQMKSLNTNLFSLVFVYVKPSVFIHYNSTHTCSLTYILLLYLPHSVLRFRLPQCDPQGLLHIVGIKRCSITQFSVSASRRCIFADFGARIVSSNAVIQGVVLECCCS